MRKAILQFAIIAGLVPTLTRLMTNSRPRVLSVSPMPPEKCAYALARYSRSADSIRESLEWVRSHDAQSFLESYYFQYGHQSIADLGHAVLCFEGVSELAAAEIEDETLWDGQAKSSRYQDFSKSGYVVPPELGEPQAATYRTAADSLIHAYSAVHNLAFEELRERLPRPDTMKPAVYERNVRARAFDVARYLLFWGVPTQVGQVTSIRTLEKQIRRLRASAYAECRAVAEEIAEACAAEPACQWGNDGHEPLAPTLARHAEQDRYLMQSQADLRAWAAQNLKAADGADQTQRVQLTCPKDTVSETVATLLFPVTRQPFFVLYDLVCGWSAAQRDEVIDVACRTRRNRDELLSAFRGAQFAFDFCIDIGAYRDMHRHRRCGQWRQPYDGKLGFETPQSGACGGLYHHAMSAALDAVQLLPKPASDYLLPFGARSRFLFKMDFAEAEYIARVRSGVKGHFSYRQVAWEMKERVSEREPALGRLMEATPPSVEDPLVR